MCVCVCVCVCCAPVPILWSILIYPYVLHDLSNSVFLCEFVLGMKVRSSTDFCLIYSWTVIALVKYDVVVIICWQMHVFFCEGWDENEWMLFTSIITGLRWRRKVGKNIFV